MLHSARGPAVAGVPVQTEETGLTGVAGSPLAGVADLVVLTVAPGEPGTMLARHPELMVLDLLSISVAQHRRRGGARS